MGNFSNFSKNKRGTLIRDFKVEIRYNRTSYTVFLLKSYQHNIFTLLCVSLVSGLTYFFPTSGNKLAFSCYPDAYLSSTMS